jgi:hypothetical protein
MRFQTLMPDVLHWLGIKKVDKMVSMSDMKYDAIVKSGIPIWTRYNLPGDQITLFHLIHGSTLMQKSLRDIFRPRNSLPRRILQKLWQETEH